MWALLSSAAYRCPNGGVSLSPFIHREINAMIFRCLTLSLSFAGAMIAAPLSWAQEAATGGTPAPNAYPVSAAGAPQQPLQQAPGQSGAAASQAPTPPL